MTDARHSEDSLAPVREALLGEARRRARELRAGAAADARAVVAAAHREAAEILSRARADGESDGRSAAAGRRAEADRAARATVLAAQCEVHAEFRQRVRDEVCALRRDPLYPSLLRTLQLMARAAAGPSAEVATDPAGGAVARAPGRRADCSLPRLAERAADALGAEVSSLWSA